jgi:hypothetical protein
MCADPGAEVQMWAGPGAEVQMWAGPGAEVQMWAGPGAEVAGAAHLRDVTAAALVAAFADCRCTSSAASTCQVVRLLRSPGADVGRVGPVPMQTWAE